MKREERLSVFCDVMPQDKQFDEVSATELVSAVVAGNDMLVTFDSIGEDKSNILTDTLSKTILGLQKDGVVVNENVLDVIFSTSDKIISGVNMDSVGGINGSEVIASMIKANIYTILSANVPFSGTISDMQSVSSGKGTKFKMIVAEPIVSRAKAGFKDGDGLNGLNAGSTLAFTSRSETQLFVTDTLTYTFNAKAKDGDTDNIALERGTNQIIVGGNIFVDDYEASASETTATRIASVDGVDYTVEFKYAEGQIVLTVSENITAGTKIFFEGGLTRDEMSKITSAIKSDIRDYTYVAQAVSIDTEISTLKARELLQNVGINIVTNDLSVSLAKVSAELKQKKIDYAVSLSVPYGDIIDITTADESTLSDKYKRVLVAVENARSDIATSSGITGNVVLVGGSSLVTIFASLSASQETTNTSSGSENAIRFVGYLKGNIPCYYNPRHDIDYPKTDGVDKIFVVGNPIDPTKKPIIDGIGLAILPNGDFGTDIDGNKVTRLEGSIVVSVNKDPRCRKQVREISVKLQ